MRSILITGFAGFVARHFVKYLSDNAINWKVYGVDIAQPAYDYSLFRNGQNIEYTELNLLNREKVLELIQRIRPDYILHLASFSSVAYSWKNPCESYANNTNLFLNIIQAVHELNLDCRILSVGSSEEYGNVDKTVLPLNESALLNPVSPYAIARVSQEMLSKLFVESFGLDIVMTRSFNHIGPWQDERFVVPSIIKRIKKISEEGKASGEIIAGDVSIIRDFLDVRDVVDAYYKLLLYGKKGEIYNVCSNKGVYLKDVIDMVADIIGVKVDVVSDPELIRPNDNKAIVGDNSKLRQDIGWTPRHEMVQTLKDMCGVGDGVYS